MVSETERMARAGNYVLGRMNAAERERAERDLETDAAFRLAVMTMAEQIRNAPQGRETSEADAAWSTLARHLATLPHMQGMDLPATSGGASFDKAPTRAPGGKGRVRARLHRWWSTLRNLLPGLGSPEGVAVLQTATRETAAIVEARRHGRLRLLLLQDFNLRADEQLALWSQHADGSRCRLGGFAPGPEIGLRGLPGVSLALTRERRSPIPAGNMGLPPLAEGLVRPLAGQDEGGERGDAERIEPRWTGRRGMPG